MDENTEESIQCRMHYDHCRRRLLKSFSWGFARSQAKLAQLTESVMGWNFTYAYPADCLAVRFVFNKWNAEQRGVDNDEFEFVNFNGINAIACDTELAFAEYTRDEKNPDKFSDEFIEALARLLAADMALVLTGSQPIMQMNYQLMLSAVAEAKLQNVVEQERKTQYPHDYASARFGE